MSSQFPDCRVDVALKAGAMTGRFSGSDPKVTFRAEGTGKLESARYSQPFLSATVTAFQLDDPSLDPVYSLPVDEAQAELWAPVLAKTLPECIGHDHDLQLRACVVPTDPRCVTEATVFITPASFVEDRSRKRTRGARDGPAGGFRLGAAAEPDADDQPPAAGGIDAEAAAEYATGEGGGGDWPATDDEAASEDSFDDYFPRAAPLPPRPVAPPPPGGHVYTFKDGTPIPAAQVAAVKARAELDTQRFLNNPRAGLGPTDDEASLVAGLAALMNGSVGVVAVDRAAGTRTLLVLSNMLVALPDAAVIARYPVLEVLPPTPVPSGSR